MSALGHVWTAPFGQGFSGELRLGRVQVMCPACLRGTRDRWPIATGFLNEEIHKLYTFEV